MGAAIPVAGFQLPVGVYMASVYGQVFFTGTVTAGRVNTKCAIVSSTTTTAGSTVVVGNTSMTPLLSLTAPLANSINEYTPTFIFAVTTPNLYYFATMTATVSGTLAGTTPAVTAGVQLLGIVRIA
jgi:hypothetical protein